MNPDSNIQTIRRLLESYYSADLSAEETQELIRLLASADNLPQDLIPDRDMILALHTMPRNDMAKERSRTRILESFDAAASRRKFHAWKIAAAAISVAACIALILILAPFKGRIARSSSGMGHTSSLTAAVDHPDSVPRRIIRLVADTIGISSPQTQTRTAGTTLPSSSKIAMNNPRHAVKTSSDSLRIKSVISKLHDMDAETEDLVADLKTTIQDDYLTAIKMMDEINDSYSSAIILKDSNSPFDHNNHNNIPLLSI